ncbi:hypothetical protein ABIE06_003435 [Pantoea dispersa]|uniref:hypothetical protein n=1 Tax=Pantoea dispersa TaxID=59814 RepID=UPI003D22D014
MQKNLSNKELVAAGHKFAANISADTPLIDMAKMVSELATQLDVALAAAAEAGKQRDQVAAENSGLKGVIGDNWNLRDVLRQLIAGRPGGCYFNKWEQLILKALNETPSTDAYLNAVRADAITYALKECSDHCDTDYVMDAYDFSYETAEIRSAGAVDFRNEISEFAAQLRAGNAGKDGV